MASAGPVTYQPDDLLLGFRATDGAGSPEDYVVDLGPASIYTNASTAFVLNTGLASRGGINLGNIGADVSFLFGADWTSRSDLLWSISGTAGQTAAGGDPLRTLYATREEIVPGLQSDPWLRANSATQSAPTNKLAGMGTAYQFINTNGATPSSATANSPVGVIQNDSDINSYASYQSGGSSFGYFPGGIEGTFANGTSGSVLDLYRLQPASGAAIGTAGQFVGVFSVDDNAQVTFTPMPEPQASGLAAGGAMLLGLVRPRRRTGSGPRVGDESEKTRTAASH